MAEPDEFFLNRARLLDGSIAKLAANAPSDVHILTDDERAASLAATLESRPAGDLWLFAYGSLIWNPVVHFVERRVATIQGWRRAFCLSSPGVCGTPDNPGLMLGLDQGGSCTGVALRIAEDVLADELSLLWRREMVANAYIPRWVDVFSEESADPFGHAIAFTIDAAFPRYAGSLPEAKTVRRLATASGTLGSSAETLFRTRDGLRSLGVPDPTMERLATLVEAFASSSSATG